MSDPIVENRYCSIKTCFDARCQYNLSLAVICLEEQCSLTVACTFARVCPKLIQLETTSWSDCAFWHTEPHGNRLQGCVHYSHNYTITVQPETQLKTPNHVLCYIYTGIVVFQKSLKKYQLARCTLSKCASEETLASRNSHFRFK